MPWRFASLLGSPDAARRRCCLRRALSVCVYLKVLTPVAARSAVRRGNCRAGPATKSPASQHQPGGGRRRASPAAGSAHTPWTMVAIA